MKLTFAVFPDEVIEREYLAGQLEQMATHLRRLQFETFSIQLFGGKERREIDLTIKD